MKIDKITDCKNGTKILNTRFCCWRYAAKNNMMISYTANKNYPTIISFEIVKISDNVNMFHEQNVT